MAPSLRTARRRSSPAKIAAACLAVLVSMVAFSTSAQAAVSSTGANDARASSSDVIQITHNQGAPWWNTQSYDVMCPSSHRYLVNMHNGNAVRISASEHITVPGAQKHGKTYRVIAALPYIAYSGARGTYHNWNVHDGSVAITLTCTSDYDKAKIPTDYVP